LGQADPCKKGERARLFRFSDSLLERFREATALDARKKAATHLFRGCGRIIEKTQGSDKVDHEKTASGAKKASSPAGRPSKGPFSDMISLKAV
jgi:hypothetical protein